MQISIGKIRKALNRGRFEKILGGIILLVFLCSCGAKQQVVKVPVGGKLPIGNVPEKPTIDQYELVKSNRTYKAGPMGAVCLSHNQFMKFQFYNDSLRNALDKNIKTIEDHNKNVDKVMKEMTGQEEKGWFGKLLKSSDK